MTNDHIWKGGGGGVEFKKYTSEISAYKKKTIASPYRTMLLYGIKVVFFRHHLYDLTLLTILPGSAHINIMPRRNNNSYDKIYKGIQAENEIYLPKLSFYFTGTGGAVTGTGGAVWKGATP
jgi:hypothetical protein